MSLHAFVMLRWGVQAATFFLHCNHVVQLSYDFKIHKADGQKYGWQRSVQDTILHAELAPSHMLNPTLRSSNQVHAHATQCPTLSPGICLHFSVPPPTVLVA